MDLSQPSNTHKVIFLIVMVIIGILCAKRARAKGYGRTESNFYFGIVIPFAVYGVVSYVFVSLIARLTFEQMGGITPDTDATMEAHNKLLAPFRDQFYICVVADVVLPLLITIVWTALFPQKRPDYGETNKE